MTAALLLVALAAAAPAAAPPPAQEQPAGQPVGQPGLHIVAGRSAIVGGNAAGARERALDEALRQAVSQALAEMLDPQTRAAQAKGIKALEARARNYVRGYRTLEEGEANGAYGIRLEAEVDELALRRAAERLGVPGGGTAAPPAGTPPRAAGNGLLLVPVGDPGAGPALAAALSAVGARAQVASSTEPAAAAQAAARASLPQIAFVTAAATDEGPVRGTGKLAVSCRIAARVVAASSGLPVAEQAAAPRTFADREETAHSDCLARAASELAARLVPAAGAAAPSDLRTINIEADVVEPGAVAALLRAVRAVGAVSSAELRRISPGRAEIRVRTRTLATALAPALSRDAAGVITLSSVEVAGDLIRLRVRLRAAPNLAPAGTSP
jgi:hypothetical protein